MKKRSWLIPFALPALLSVLALGAAESKPSTAPVALFNGKDLAGWKAIFENGDVDPTSVWSVKDGVLCCTGKPHGYIRTETEFADYRLRLEWRWPGTAGNSGVLLHVTGKDKVWPKCIEAQLLDEKAGDFWVVDGVDFKEHVNKADRHIPKKDPREEKELGEWNQYEVVCRADTIHVFVNGVLQNEATQCTERKGKIAIQSEGAPIEFRNITLEPLGPDPVTAPDEAAKQSERNAR